MTQEKFNLLMDETKKELKKLNKNELSFLVRNYCSMINELIELLLDYDNGRQFISKTELFEILNFKIYKEYRKFYKNYLSR